ncbi:membrane protein insertase YidC [Clostridium sp. CM028]|uniref:membrane protein insertase YidC n=1 Tax=unclassified Clostridium TaxID=2614128 RepID=UPI001C0A9850|nr:MULTISPECIES: membrane protein insertase YidC [unclassified Clostridium]MBU3091159.1 membrane protein insertase YidC [Clostridium sp. CF011]MBW9144859.1 membrane protein insertase YidC [Clostridium sp. CM027]MBW9148722.1 membrane protein insertase YidC [Clostridium sp. CM028]UVE40002.1 membrane protein insertase YidC [Clostridium sp. CM027]WAG68925.1 membrane protein insertase YidC [Clostridium sp. CF011]
MKLQFLSDPLSKFFFLIHNGVNTLIPNNDISFGLTIIIFTVIIRVILLPLSIKQTKSTAKMGAIQPEMKKVQEKYKKDPQKSQQEVMKLYKENGVNPMGGCLPMLVQMPILFALFYVFNNLDMQGAGFLWMNDLTKPDPLYILPILSTVTTYFSSKLMQPPGDAAKSKQTSTMNTAMAIFMGFMSLKFKGALVLYWVINNLLQVVQTLVINKMELPKKES